MARVPLYAYRVIVSKRLGDKLTIESHNYETLPGAWAYRDIALSQSRTTKVEIVVVLDESTPTHRTEGVVNGPQAHPRAHASSGYYRRLA